MLTKGRLTSLRVLRHLAALAVAGLLLGVELPALTGVPWATTLGALSAVTAPVLAVLFAIWAIGLLAHTVTLTGALPGLSHRRALTLSLTGSAVANLLPLGGAAGIAVNYRMVRAWGFDRSRFAAYTVITNVWDVLTKLALLPLAFVVVLAVPRLGLPSVVGVATAATIVVLVVLPALGWALLTASGARRIGAGADRLVALVRRRSARDRDASVETTLLDLQRDCGDVIRASWRRLTVGMVLYTASLASLLWVCLHVAGAGIPTAAVVVGFAVERVLTLAGLTPGGAGLVELGLVGLLVLYGGVPAAVVSAIVLYRCFTFGLEIPVGGLWLVGWAWWRSRTSVRTMCAAP